MNYIELSIKNVKEESIRLAEKIKNEYNPDVVVFIARGSYMIGCEIGEYFNCDIVEIFATRKGDNLKKKMSKILKKLPTWIKIKLRKLEFNSNIHSTHKERIVKIIKKEDILKKSKKILIVDDSVDTGYSAKQVHEYIESICDNSQIKFAAFNVFNKSKEVYNVDFSLFDDCIMIGPWSKDSKYYDDYMTNYERYKHNNIF